MWAREPPDGANPEPDEQPAPRERGRPLDAATRGRAERAFGQPLGDVRVHAGGDGARLAESVGARATARGEELTFAAGEYAPGTLFGNALIAHELAHVAQQRAGLTRDGAGGDDASLERDADRAAAGVLGFGDGAFAPRERGGPALQRCSSRGQSLDAGTFTDAGVSDAGADAGPTSDGGADRDAAAVANVRSLNLEKFRKDEATDPAHAMATLRRSWKTRDKAIRSRVAMKLTKADAEPLARLQSRWTPLSAQFSAAGFDPFTAPLDESAIRALVRADQEDSTALSASVYNHDVKDSVASFADAVSALLTVRRQAAEEPAEFRRYDTLFLDPEVRTLLDGGAAVKFTPAELKALMAQETGDFTNVDIAGNEGKQRGIVTHRENAGFIGLAQMDTRSRNEAIAWAEGRGVQIPPTPDPRVTPATAVKLAAAYIGRVQDLLREVWPLYTADVRERKRLTLAAYNFGPTGVRDLVRAKAKRGHLVVYDDIAGGLSGQARSYVRDISARVGL